jgi:hypothetical protein
MQDSTHIGGILSPRAPHHLFISTELEKRRWHKQPRRF